MLYTATNCEETVKNLGEIYIGGTFYYNNDMILIRL